MGASKGKSGRPKGLDVASVGCDYLTASVPLALDQALPLQVFMDGLLHRSAKAGNKEGPAPWGHGIKGMKVGSVALGRSTTHLVVQASSEWARLYAGEMIRMAHKVSRCDLQVTCKLHNPWPRFAWEFKSMLEAHNGKAKRPTKGDLHIGIPHGDSLTWGAKSSAIRGIIYDKGSESGQVAEGELQPGELLRMEVRYYDDHATSIAREVFGKGDLMSEWNGTRRAVHTEFSRRGMKPLFARQGKELRPQVEKRETDDVRFARYVANNIAPGIARRVERGDPAVTAMLLQALEGIAPADVESPLLQQCLANLRRAGIKVA
jgi:hypothetical protein